MSEGFSASDDGFTGGRKILFLQADKICFEALARNMSWGPRVTPAPVRGPSENVYP